MLALAGCGDPIVMLPGGELDGTLTEAPAEWENVPDTVQAEFRPGRDPYSINIWAIGIGPDLYIATGKDGTRWTQMLADDPAVRLRINERIYALMASPVTETSERQRVYDRYVEKYDIDTGSDMLEGAIVYRLDR